MNLNHKYGFLRLTWEEVKKICKEAGHELDWVL
jgi:hypothetical protein